MSVIQHAKMYKGVTLFSARHIVNSGNMRHKHSFKNIEQERLNEASRSLLVHHRTPQDRQIKAVWNRFGKIKTINHFTVLSETEETKQFFSLVEFAELRAVQKVMKEVDSFLEDAAPVMHGHIFFGVKNGNKVSRNIKNKKPEQYEMEYNLEAHELKPSELLLASNISSQMSVLYNHYKMSELDTRLRYFVCANLERCLKALFYKCSVQPYGSCNNGIGSFHGDLDLSLCLNSNNKTSQSVSYPAHLFELKFYSKLNSVSSKKLIKVIGDLMYNVYPFCHRIVTLSQARIPIVKFKEIGIGLDSDLSIDNSSGVLMSRFVHTLCRVDQRFQLLLFTIRAWAKQVEGICEPGRGISNFILTMLTVHFLQVCDSPVLPSVADISEDYSSVKILDDHIVKLFFTYVNKKSRNLKNKDLPELLLLQFFKYYSTFDFSENAISVLRGCVFPNPDKEVMFIENATELEHNVCRNVNSSHLEIFQEQSRKAFEKLESSSTQSTDFSWGLTSIIDVDNIPQRNIISLDDSMKVVPKKVNIVLSNLLSSKKHGEHNQEEKFAEKEEFHSYT